ncbi:hypothetical protein LCGC14_2690190, partial [marine sediment metagenome]
ANVELIHEKPPTRLYRLQCNGRSVVIKWFADARESIEIRGYALLQRLGVPTLPVYGQSDNAIVIEDLATSTTWRLATADDCECPDVGRAAARWYRRLHEPGRNLLAAPRGAPEFLRRESDPLTPQVILAMGESLGVGGDVWQLAAEHVELLKQAERRRPTSLNYNDFHWSNLALSREVPLRAVVFDYHLLGIGMAYSDCRNVLSCLRPSAADAFKEAYGPIDQREASLDAPVSILVALKAALDEHHLPRWAQGLIQMVASGELEHALQRALEII